MFLSDKDGCHPLLCPSAEKQTLKNHFCFSSKQFKPVVTSFPKCGSHRELFYYNIYLCMCGECFPLKLLMHHFHHSAQQEESCALLTDVPHDRISVPLRQSPQLFQLTQPFFYFVKLFLSLIFEQISI